MISVIVPTRDRVDDALSCLRALSAQDAGGLISQVIVVDDNSSTAYGSRLRAFARTHALPLLFVANIPGRGTAVARNAGAALATGDILAFLDDDSVPASDWLGVIAARFGDKDTAAITGRLLPSDGERILSRARQLRYEMRQAKALQAPREPVNFLAGGNSAIRRDDFERLGGFDTSYKLMHDREMALRLKKAGRCCFYAHDLLAYHRHSKGTADALRSSLVSAHYKLLLERTNKEEIPAWSLRRQLGSSIQILRFGRAGEQLLPAFAAVTLEWTHALAYVTFKGLPTLGGLWR